MTPEKHLYQSSSDADLLLLTHREPEAFGCFYDRHVEAIAQFFVKRTTCAQTAADLTAETFAEALRCTSRYRPRNGDARGWLFGIAKNRLNRYQRKAIISARSLRLLRIEELQLDNETLERMEAWLDAAPQIAQLRHALRDMSPALRDAVILRVGHNLAFEEVSKRLGCSVGAARVRVTRALSQLALLVSPQEEFRLNDQSQ